MARRYGEAREHLEDAVKLEPRFWPGQVMRLQTLIALGRYDEAIAQAEAVTELRRSDKARAPPSPYKGYALARLGRRADAEKVLDEIRTQTSQRHTTGEALVLHGLGRDDEALLRLQAAVNARDQDVTFLGVYPWWDDLRQVSGFRAILSQVNLLEVSDRRHR